MKYKIRVTEWCKPEKILVEYYAGTHPNKSDVIVLENKEFVVGSVTHILRTIVDANGETTSLDYVELQVLK